MNDEGASTFPTLARIAKEMYVQSPTKCIVGVHNLALPERLERIYLRPDDWIMAAGKQLGHFVYNAFYLGRASNRAGSEQSGIEPVPDHEQGGFGVLLRQANAGSGWLSDGWEIVRKTGSKAEIRNGKLLLVAEANDLISAGNNRVAVRFPKHLPYRSPGYYMAVSNAGLPDTGALMRIYINVKAVAAPVLLKRVTSFVCEHSIAAIIKVLNHPKSFDRPDAMVIYIGREGGSQILGFIGSILNDIASYISERVPGFAKRWKPGVGLAEEPVAAGRSAASFGEHRSALIGKALAQAYVKHNSGDDACYEELRLSRILSVLRGEKLDPERLYLNPGSEEFDFQYAEHSNN